MKNYVVLKFYKNKTLMQKVHLTMLRIFSVGLRRHVSWQLKDKDMKLFLFHLNLLYYKEKIHKSRTPS